MQWKHLRTKTWTHAHRCNFFSSPFTRTQTHMHMLRWTGVWSRGSRVWASVNPSQPHRWASKGSVISRTWGERERLQHHKVLSSTAVWCSWWGCRHSSVRHDLTTTSHYTTSNSIISIDVEIPFIMFLCLWISLLCSSCVVVALHFPEIIIKRCSQIGYTLHHVSNSRPVGRIRPTTSFYAARESFK